MGHVRDYKGRLYLCYTDATGRRRQMGWHSSRRSGERALREIVANVESERLGIADAKTTASISLASLVEGYRAHVQTYRRPATWEAYFTPCPAERRLELGAHWIAALDPKYNLMGRPASSTRINTARGREGGTEKGSGWRGALGR